MDLIPMVLSPISLEIPTIAIRETTVPMNSEARISSQYFLITSLRLYSGIAKAIVAGLKNQKIKSPPGL